VATDKEVKRVDAEPTTPAPIIDGEGESHKAPSAKSDGGRDQAQARMDVYTEQGFRGVSVDPTPNENYTVAGVTAGAPTPETDVDAEAAAAGPLPLASEAALDAERAKNAKG